MSAPLLSESVRRSSEPFDGLQSAFGQTPGQTQLAEINEQHPFSLGGRFPTLSRRSSNSSHSSDVDIQQLSLSFAQVGSFGSGSFLDTGVGRYGLSEQRPKTVLKHPSTSITATQVYGTFGDEDEESGVLKDADDIDEDDRFIGISPPRFWLLFLVIALGYFIACFDSTLMASSHPVITSFFGASQAASWLSTVFLITSTACQPLFGRLSDTIGRKPVYLLSLFIFGVTTAWCAVANSIESFIAARAVCGLGAGGTMSLSLIILSDLVHIEHRGVFQSHINLAFGLGSASGAALGGWLCDSLGWRWAFGIQVPVIGLCLIMAFVFTPSHMGPMLLVTTEGGAWSALKSFDYLGSVTLSLTVTSLILALNLGGNLLPWSSPVVLSCFVGFAMMGCLFVVIETRTPHPLMPLHLLCKAPVANLVFANLLGGVASNTILFNLPLFFQAVLLTSASDSGFRLALPSLVGSFAGISTGYIITYTRQLKPTLVAGAVVYMLGSVATCSISKHTSPVMTLILIAGVPLGQGFVFPNTMMSALAVSEQAQQAVVTTTIGLWRNLGIVLGVAVSSLVFQNSLTVNLRRIVKEGGNDELIERARSSVQSIKLLPLPLRDQVTDAYAFSLRTSFLCAIAASAVMIVLILPIKLPRLRRGREMTFSTAE
ncbi:hypothetical protein PV08_03954 [Exophiala spinifera]|uniref:Major facilitator superfamily (MFS) profile domain-containing protein n=1 Tax=Exophiala spinifera TaxID=91928 RepID=A0A0D2BZJ6_9EURO|nr:uncharacterized protein PV08_03954 [Exophiala spinifera]KIW16764.1 hypothetical protein PV08_03954 [Exophiala spinifera]